MTPSAIGRRSVRTSTDYTADEFRSFVSTNLEGLISHLELLFAWTHLDSPYGGDK